MLTKDAVSQILTSQKENLLLKESGLKREAPDVRKSRVPAPKKNVQRHLLFLGER
jgi:hypothetical protein